MASIISAGTTSGTALNMAGDTSGVLQLATNGSTTAVTVDASQNVGIGVTPSAWFTGTSWKALQISTGGAAFTGNESTARIFFNAFVDSTGNSKYTNTGVATQYAQSAGQHLFYTAPSGTAGNAITFTEVMRIDSSGNVGIGGTPSFLLDINTNTASLITSRLARNPSDGNFAIGFKNGVTGGISGTEMARLRWGYGGTDNAYISAERDGGTGANRINVVCNMTGGVFLSAGGTSWGSLSDERQKTNLEPIVDASNKLNTLRTVTGRYITDEETVSRAFLIAQDVQTVLPEAVDVQENEEGTLGLRYTDLIPLLIAGFKEQQTIINDLKARITALEGAA